MSLKASDSLPQENVIPGIRTGFLNIPVDFIFSVRDVA
jgi:hypothetical protein